MRQLQRGDMAALDSLYHLHATRALRTAYLITRNRAAAEDAIQEAFIQVMRHIAALRDAEAFRPWFYRIVVNAAKRLARRGALPLDPAWGEQSDPTSPLPDEQVASASEAAQLRHAVGALPDSHRLPIILRYYTGLTDADIGQALGIPAGTVKSRLYAARKMLLLQLEPIDSPVPITLPAHKPGS